MNFKKLSALLVLALILLPTMAFAAMFKGDSEVFLSQDFNDDVYLAGEIVQVDSSINGDLYLAGGNVTVNGQVSEDLALAAGNAVITGEVGDDLRLGAGDAIISASIGDDLIVGAGNLELTADSKIGGDLIMGSGNANLNGAIEGNIYGGAGAVYINNEVKGTVHLPGVDQLRFGPNAKVLGNLKYKSRMEASGLTDGMVVGTIEYSATETPMAGGEEVAEVFFGFSIFRLLSALFTGLFFVWVARFYLTGSARTSYEKSLKSLGLGFLILFVSPILWLVLMVTGIGLPLAFLLVMAWVIALMVAKLVAMMMIGMKLVKIDDKSSFLRVYGAFAAGAVVFIAIGMIPLVGWVVKMLLMLIALGALAFYELETFRFARKKKLV